MADILIVGALELLSEDLYLALAEEYRVVLSGRKISSKKYGKKIVGYSATPMESQFAQLFDVYSFQAVYYISGYADNGNGKFGEVQQLEQVLSACVSAQIEKVVILTSVESLNFEKAVDSDGYSREKNYLSSRALIAGQLEELCAHFTEKFGLKVITLHLPYIAAPVNRENFLGRVFSGVYHGEEISFPYGEQDRMDLISLKDLTRLLKNITEETDDRSQSYFVCSGYPMNYGEFYERLLKLSKEQPQAVYENRENRILWQDYPHELRRAYGFIPKDNVAEDLENYYHAFVAQVAEERKNPLERWKELLTKQTGIFKYLELFVVFLLVEWLNSYMSVSVYFKFVDVRLLFIVMMATMYGMKVGLAASALECIALGFEYWKIGVDWTLLFYNIENWIPFAAYLMAGSVVGYIKNKNTDELTFLQQEHQLLNDKYLFLNNAYQGALENKGEYKKQIIGFKDSFGKIFDAIQKLDTVVPEKIFLEGLQVMEEILENHSIAIYSLDQWQRYGRLVVCSSSLTGGLSKSLKLEDYKKLYDTVKEGDVWKNSDLLPGMPMYADGVFQDGRLVLLIVIYKADIEQCGVRYMNIFHIMSGLVQTAFLRALDYEKWREEQIYFPETSVTYPERFRKLVEIQRDMKQAGVADFILLKLAEKDRKKASEEISGMIRSTDTMGADDDGNLYVLLTQVGTDTFHFVGDRLERDCIAYEIVKEVG